jgi:hypothetical protein
MKRISALAALLALLVVAMPQPAPAAASLAQLRGIPELKNWFNGLTGRPRLILLLSPT